MTKSGVGRPSKYKPEFARIAEKLSALGATDKDLADAFDVVESTINEWKLDHPDFSESLKAKRIPDDEIEASLFKRAKGYIRTIQRVTKDGDVVDTEEELPPDPTSMIFWLKNRRPKQWRDKQEHEVTGKEGQPLQAVLNIVTNK